jgi:hypothetical protein
MLRRDGVLKQRLKGQIVSPGASLDYASSLRSRRDVLIADTFADSLARLIGDGQKSAHRW